MSSIVIFSVPFIILYGLGLFFWRRKVRWRLNDRFLKRLKYAHYALGALIIASVLLMIIDEISFRGQWATRIILIGFVLSGIFVYLLGDWAHKSKVEKVYFGVFSFFPLLAAGVSLIPFLGVVLFLSLFGRLTEPVTDIYYDDDRLRVQSTFIGVLGPPRLDIFEKNGLFEKRINQSYRSAADVDSVEVSRGLDETLVIIYKKRYEEKATFDVDTIKFKRVD